MYLFNQRNHTAAQRTSLLQCITRTYVTVTFRLRMSSAFDLLFSIVCIAFAEALQPMACPNNSIASFTSPAPILVLYRRFLFSLSAVILHATAAPAPAVSPVARSRLVLKPLPPAPPPLAGTSLHAAYEFVTITTPQVHYHYSFSRKNQATHLCFDL